MRELPLKFNTSFSVRCFRWRFVQMTEFFFSIDLFPVFIADGALWIPFFCVQKLRRRGWGGGVRSICLQNFPHSFLWGKDGSK